MESQSSHAITSKKRSFRSMVWDHFAWVAESDPENPKSKCNYCAQQFACHTIRNGTSNMTHHLKICKKYLMVSDAKQQTLPFGKAGEERSSSSSSAFTQEIGRDALARMLIKDELLMRLVEWEGFKEYSKVLNGSFVLPSRRTVGRDIEKIHRKEKGRLANYIKESGRRVFLTTDTWTSNQNINYMVLTTHFLDGHWNIHKKILNFCNIEDHRGDSISNKLETCLHSWGIEKVCTITVDNASYNDVAIENFVRSLRHENGLILDGECVHVRCFAHILNLIVSEGVKEHEGAIDKVRKAVMYVKSSPKRLQAFKNCVDSIKIQFKGNVTLDVPTRWNSMYLMLENAEKYSKAFEKMGDSDRGFQLAMTPNGPPRPQDWVEIRDFCKFLHVFYDITVNVSASLHITAHEYVIEIYAVKQNIEKHSRSEILTLINMAHGMISKFNKY